MINLRGVQIGCVNFDKTETMLFLRLCVSYYIGHPNVCMLLLFRATTHCNNVFQQRHYIEEEDDV